MRILPVLAVLAACGSSTPTSTPPAPPEPEPVVIAPDAAVEVPPVPLPTTAKVTIPEGKSMLETFALIEAALIANANDLETLARDKELLAMLGVAGDTAEGYLFPDTYVFRIGEEPRNVVARLIRRHQQVWTQLVHEHPDETAKLKAQMGWSDRDILTMASIVEKEAADPSERSRIAQVFINRLSSPTFKPKRLQTDPATRYGCLVPLRKSTACAAWNDACVSQGAQPGCDRLRRAQLDDRDNPYNTYAHEGLPPGPIANPGKAAIEATLVPDGSDYLYFVGTAKGARTHVFAKTLVEHERKVKKYVESAPTN